MSVSWKYVRHHGPVLAGIGRTAVSVVLGNKARGTPAVPGPQFEVRLPPRDPGLVAAYVRAVGGDPSAYKRELPPHMFPQWGFGPASRTLEGVPYPIAKVVNGGARFVSNAPLDPKAPLDVSAQLVSVDDDGRRAVLEQRIVTGNPGNPEALVASLFAIVPLPRPADAQKGPRKPKPTVPTDVREVARLSVGRNAGLDFAKVTGDFNPIHWIPAYAKASGFKSTILHGFGTMARAIEAMNRNVFSGAAPVRSFECRFTRPLVLPARVGVYVRGQEVWVGDAPGGAAYMHGNFSLSA